MFFNELKEFFQPSSNGKMTPKKATGNWAESLATKRLKEKGYKIVARNWTHGKDELDIVAVEDAQIVFVEVRARQSTGVHVPGALSLDSGKKTAVRRAALAYLRPFPSEPAWRFDVVEVSYKTKKDYELYHYEGVQL